MQNRVFFSLSGLACRIVFLIVCRWFLNVKLVLQMFSRVAIAFLCACLISLVVCGVVNVFGFSLEEELLCVFLGFSYVLFLFSSLFGLDDSRFF